MTPACVALIVAFGISGFGLGCGVVYLMWIGRKR